MTDTYDSTVSEVKALLTQAILEKEPELEGRIHAFDERLAELMREAARGVMEELSNTMAQRQEARLKAEGMTVQERKTSPFLPSSGPSTSSPSISETKSGGGPHARPSKP